MNVFSTKFVRAVPTYCKDGKFGGELNLMVWRSSSQPPNVKSTNIYFLLAYIPMATPYRTAKFKSANIFAIAILGPTAIFNSHQYFWLYDIGFLHSTKVFSAKWFSVYESFLPQIFPVDLTSGMVHNDINYSSTNNVKHKIFL